MGLFGLVFKKNPKDFVVRGELVVRVLGWTSVPYEGEI